MAVFADLTEEEAYLYTILTDQSGVDLAEFCWFDPDADGEVWRAWPFQWKWFHNESALNIDQSGRSIGKSLSIKLRGFVFPFVHPGQEMVVTAPELVHLEPIVRLIESQILNTRLTREMMPKSRSQITHRPFMAQFQNGARIIGRIPQRDGRGLKGCVGEGTLILTKRGLVPVEQVMVGDLVWSHEQRWSPVLEVQEFEDDAVVVKGQGILELVTSLDHRFYVRENKNPQKKRNLGMPTWGYADNIDLKRTYWSSPANFEGAFMVPECGELRQTNPGFWWLVGLYLADGYLECKKGSPNRVNFVVHPDKQAPVMSILTALEFNVRVIKRDHSSADVLQICHSEFARWLQSYCGRGAKGKIFPTFALGTHFHARKWLLDGYLYGDGYLDERGRLHYSTASKNLAIGMKLLGQTLGYTANMSGVQPKTTHINGVELKNEPLFSWQGTLSDGIAIQEDGFHWTRMRSIEPVGKRTLYNVISEDHSYVSDGIISHNTHPIWLEMDESQDFPDAGWVEITETLKRGHDGAMWRVHGVTRGLRDYFYKYTQPDSGWDVNRYTALHRPTWTDQERTEKIAMYGSRDAPDYRRNIMGSHGDSTNPLFVLHRLMACIDTDEDSKYNTKEYVNQNINAEYLLEMSLPIEEALHIPIAHMKMEGRWWFGMDVGYMSHPTEILGFCETVANRKNDHPVLKLMCRFHLERIKHGDQVDAILELIRRYRPVAFALDKTGLGLPLFQDLQQRAPDLVPIIKGYNFSSKILVDFDQSISVDPYREDAVKKAGIERNVLEYASDVLRDMVDSASILMPYDKELIREFSGQTWTADKSGMDQYGRRRIFNKGKFHALDGARMAVLGYAQYNFEKMLEPVQSDVHDVFFA